MSRHHGPAVSRHHGRAAWPAIALPRRRASRISAPPNRLFPRAWPFWLLATSCRNSVMRGIAGSLCHGGASPIHDEPSDEAQPHIVAPRRGNRLAHVGSMSAHAVTKCQPVRLCWNSREAAGSTRYASRHPPKDVAATYAVGLSDADVWT
jgi:hypothetical protein